jgi:two-component system cell cycle response regulator DivK
LPHDDKDDTADPPPLVLVVDDHVDIRQAFAEELRYAGFRTVEAENGVIAVKLAHELLPDAVLLDFAMPMMDGVQASLCLKRDPLTRHIPIVLVSAFGDLLHRRGRWDALLEKPCTPREATEKIASFLVARLGPPSSTKGSPASPGAVVSSVGRSAFDFHEAPTLPTVPTVPTGKPRPPPSPDAPLVLVVDDDEETRGMYAISLELMGYRSSSQASGELGVEAALREAPMAIVMDVAMPGIDGIEATRRIKADPRGRGSFVIAVTAHGTGMFDKARDAGCDAYFCKPFNPFALDAVLRVLRSPPPGGDPSTILKTCGCGETYTHARWLALPLCGRMHVPGGERAIELRNCPCGSSLGIEFPNGFDD